MKYLPLFLDLVGRSALVVGGGAAAAAKARLLLKAGAEVTVIARRPEHEVLALADAGRVALHTRAFAAGDVDDRALVIAATEDAGEAAAVSAAARAARVPVNCVDRPELSDFITPAIVDRDPVVVGISTGGAAPVLARRVRAAVEAALPPGLGRLARFAADFRAAAAARLRTPQARARFWDGFFDGPLADAVLRGDARDARRAALRELNGAGDGRWNGGRVVIVGAGPGDPELLTLKAVRFLQQADVIVYDRLVGPGVLEYARRDAERIYVGKTKGRHARSQAEINALLVREAGAGRCIVRLKGGDPFLFGRGGEELAYLTAAAVAVEVVPGITAATGCAAVAGIPLTHRDLASGVTFISGHSKSGAPTADWRALAESGNTIVVYMGLSTADAVAGALIDHGLAAGTPVAIVARGTLPRQSVATGTLVELPALAARHAADGPALIVIGEVVRLATAGARDAAIRAVAG